MSTSAIVRTALAALSDPKVRKAVGWALVAVLSPIILLLVFLCCLGSGLAQHNNAMVDYCFNDAPYVGEIPDEFRDSVEAVKGAFSSLDTAIEAVNEIAEDDCLDPTQVKAAFFILCPGGELDTSEFLSCFYTTEERRRDPPEDINDEDAPSPEDDEDDYYTVAVPYPLSTVYSKLGILLGCDISAKDQESIREIGSMAAHVDAG